MPNEGVFLLSDSEEQKTNALCLRPPNTKDPRLKNGGRFSAAIS